MSRLHKEGADTRQALIVLLFCVCIVGFGFIVGVLRNPSPPSVVDQCAENGYAIYEQTHIICRIATDEEVQLINGD